MSRIRLLNINLLILLFFLQGCIGDEETRTLTEDDLSFVLYSLGDEQRFITNFNDDTVGFVVSFDTIENVSERTALGNESKYQSVRQTFSTFNSNYFGQFFMNNMSLSGPAHFIYSFDLNKDSSHLYEGDHIFVEILDSVTVNNVFYQEVYMIPNHHATIEDESAMYFTKADGIILFEFENGEKKYFAIN